MRTLLFIAFISLSSVSFSQYEVEYWSELSTGGDIVKRLDWSAELNTRFDRYGLSTLFPQVGLEYKIKKWIKPSVDYRFISSRNKYGNYKISHRFNFNLKYKDKLFKRFYLEGRLRYQYAFRRIQGLEPYNPDFDQAVRVKVGGEYDIKSFPLTPEVNTEVFIDPFARSRNEFAFNKLRSAFGFKLDIKGNHDFSFKYMLENSLSDPTDDLGHIFSLSYGYSL